MRRLLCVLVMLAAGASAQTELIGNIGGRKTVDLSGTWNVISVATPRVRSRHEVSVRSTAIADVGNFVETRSAAA